MSVQKAWIESETGDKLECLFNPAELSLAKSNTWISRPKQGRTAPQLEFGGGNPGSISMELTLDTTATGKPVTDHTSKLLDLMNADVDGAANAKRPPWVKFHWGDSHSFKAIIESLEITFTYFASNGDALRARVNVQLTQYEETGSWGPQNPTSGTPRPQLVHQVKRGETLDRLASLYYGDPTQWRLIADANGIEDPLSLSIGANLAIPKREAARAV